MRIVVLALLLAGCYDPSPPDGAYLCSAGDQACPSGQHCTCGQCVKHDEAAACGFQVMAAETDVREHEAFAVTIRALDGSGAPAASFGGTVTLSASWGDVQPATVALTGGTATAMVSLNRETLSPAVATVTASFAGQKGTSGGINVSAPNFTVQLTDDISNPFGWAKQIVTEGALIKEGSIYEMYFIGQGPGRYGVGLATSVDGKTFTPLTDPVLQAMPSADLLYSPSVYVTPTDHLMAYAVSAGIGLADSPDGKAFTLINNGQAVLANTQCSYCGKGVTFPQVLADPAGGYVMFFSAIASDGTVSIGRASSPDGMAWTPEPAPLLSSGLTGEQILLSPRVMLDGTVWKMWYSYANLSDLPSCLGGCPTGSTCNTSTGSCLPNDLGDSFFSFCQPTTRVQVGYATSADGFFWTKSIHNPVVPVNQFGGDRAVLTTSVLPNDGVNGSSGTALWMSPFRKTVDTGGRCAPINMRRATRP
jgi:hypothetical protein